MGYRKPIVILYGSETGNSEDYAYCLSRKLRYERYVLTVCSLDEFDLKELLDINCLIIICSTAGQGEIPRNGRNFWRFMLRKRLPSDLFSHLKFTSFGLGDSSYPKYNSAVRKIHARFLQLGAKELCIRGEGNEQAPEGVDAFYTAWEEIVISSLKTQFPLSVSLLPIPETELLEPTTLLKPLTQKKTLDTEVNMKMDAIERYMDDHSDKLIKFVVLENKRLTTVDHFQDVRLLKLQCIDCVLSYEPGDLLSLYPSNDLRDVNALIELQGWTNIADLPLQIEGPLKVPGGLIKNLTLKSFIMHHLDIMSIPRRSFFSLAWHFASDQMEQDKLREFSKPNASEQLYDYANRPRRSILEVLQEFSSLKIPLNYLPELIPQLKPRLFSISSKPDKSIIELTVAIVEYKTIIRRLRRGVCTRWVKTLSPGDLIVSSLVKNRMGHNFMNDRPIVMIGAGTGIAPIKSLIEESIINAPSRPLCLFPGHRYSNKDYLYGQLWSQLEREEKLLVFPSFSRENSAYVQDTLYKNKDLVNRLIVFENASIFLCGSSGKMPSQVRLTLEAIFAEMNQWTEDEARKYLIALEDKGSYVQETW
ncbi:hypothetical protein KL925_002904 [Ogataea polymorpha]|nr:hypothetical protein KL936_002771 [Ogataea polymorpha]KAG7909374.1 hypothetical protein KL906_002130 [Ogataea polymorpha]KAG7916894.1 hypothetical protein KL927_002668 [Ogataea polymorpha]KAG7926619.1 hypothetical protein KL925_002904 [Ogataea polymorpha]